MVLRNVDLINKTINFPEEYLLINKAINGPEEC
jgi:hypothetical protein